MTDLERAALDTLTDVAVRNPGPIGSRLLSPRGLWYASPLHRKGTLKQAQQCLDGLVKRGVAVKASGGYAVTDEWLALRG